MTIPAHLMERYEKATAKQVNSAIKICEEFGYPTSDEPLGILTEDVFTNGASFGYQLAMDEHQILISKASQFESTLKETMRVRDQYKQLLDEVEKVLKFYSLKSNYSLVDEGRNYNVDYKCYELNEETYADEELGTRAREMLEKLKAHRGGSNV